LLALLQWPDSGGTTAGSSDSDTSGEISPEKKALHYTVTLSPTPSARKTEGSRRRAVPLNFEKYWRLTNMMPALTQGAEVHSIEL